jgi:hypothetical protein
VLSSCVPGYFIFLHGSTYPNQSRGYVTCRSILELYSHSERSDPIMIKSSQVKSWGYALAQRAFRP